MGAVMVSNWIHYHMRLFEPHWYGPPELIEECLSLMEKNGGEDISFRQYVIDFVNNSKHYDNFHIPDNRIYYFLAKNTEAKTSLSGIMKEWNTFVSKRPRNQMDEEVTFEHGKMWIPSGPQEVLNDDWKARILREFEEYKKS